MKKTLLAMVAAIFLFSACTVPPGQIKKQGAPGQVQKKTGANPASGKKK